MNTLSIGYSRKIGSPDKFPQPQNSTLKGTALLTDIQVTCIALSDGKETTLISSNDIRNFSPEFSEAYIKAVSEATGIAPEKILVTATHNHSAPDATMYARDDTIRDWADRIYIPASVEAAKEALADLSPVVKMTSGKSHVEHVTFVRRYFCADGSFRSMAGKKDEPVAHETEADTELRALRFYREGKKDVVVTNFQVHAATALGASRDLICADFLHAFRETAEAGGDFSVIYLQGGCGNLNTFSRIYEDACNKDYDRVGVLIGQGLLEALKNEEERSLGSLCVKREYLTGHVNHTRDHMVEEAKAALARDNASADLTPAEKRAIYEEAGFSSRLDAWAVVSKSRMEKIHQIPLSTVSFGDVGMTFVPFEQFDTNCQQIRAASPFDFTMTVGYTNLRHHYLPSAFGFANVGYEGGQCYYIPGTGETVALELLRMLKEAKKAAE